MQETNVWTKAGFRQYISNGIVTSYTGPSVSVEQITEENGWINTGPPPPYTRDVITASPRAENEYVALIQAGQDPSTASRLSGYTPGG
jgi:hypothetical protein